MLIHWLQIRQEKHILHKQNRNIKNIVKWNRRLNDAVISEKGKEWTDGGIDRR